MATALTVPRRYQGGFAKISGLDDESFRELLAALWKVPSTISYESITSAVAAMVETIPMGDVEEIVPAVLFAHQAQETFGASPSIIAERITVGMEEVVLKRLRLTPERREAFRNRMLELLNLSSLGVIAKAGGLSVETEHSLTETRILTDVRPIFEPGNPQAPPTGAVILHTLKVSYRADNQSKDFFVTLDANDVRELQEQLQRADAKSESLKSVLEAAEVPFIDTE